MKKILIIAGLIAVAPMGAYAMGCQYGHDKQVNNCAEGTAWDADLKTCVPSVSS